MHFADMLILFRKSKIKKHACGAVGVALRWRGWVLPVIDKTHFEKKKKRGEFKMIKSSIVMA